MAGIQNLGVVDNPSTTNYDTTTGHLAFTADSNYLCSVIVSNYELTDAEVYVYVVPTGSTNYTNEDSWAQIAYKVELEGYNTFETLRFGINNTDEIWVAGTGGLRFFVQGIEQA